MAEWQMEFGSEPPQPMGELLHEVVDGHMAARMTANQRAAAAWYRANGDRERDHTTGVFLKKARHAGMAPILCVYVDSHAMVTDFGVNKDIYLARLANVGYEVSGIEFIPSRKEYRAGKRIPRATQPRVAPLPPLTDEEQQTVASLVADLPESLRANVSKAVSLSMQRNKQQRPEKENKAE